MIFFLQRYRRPSPKRIDDGHKGFGGPSTDSPISRYSVPATPEASGEEDTSRFPVTPGSPSSVPSNPPLDRYAHRDTPEYQAVLQEVRQSKKAASFVLYVWFLFYL